MKICICDDEVLFIEETRNAVSEIMKENNRECEIKLFSSSAELIQSGEAFDMAFIDIEMPQYKGTAVASELQKINPYIFVFFITSFNSYLDEAMDLKAFRFLSKPIDKKRLKDGIEKALNSFDNSSAEVEVFVEHEKAIEKIKIADITFVEISGRKTIVHTAKESYDSKKKFDEWQSLLNGDSFYRVHGSFIVNMNYITGFEYDTVNIGTERIPVSARKRTDFKKKFMKLIGGNL